MRSKLATLLVIYLLFSVTQLDAAKYPKHQLGINFSTISGTGLSYRLLSDRSNTLQFTIMPYYTDDDPNQNLNFTIISGIEYQRNFHLDSKNRIYAYGAASLWYFEKRDKKIINPNSDLEQEIFLYDKDVFHNLGLGVGYDYTLNELVSFNLNLGLQYQFTSNDSFNNFLERTEGKPSFIGLGGGAGIFFHL